MKTFIDQLLRYLIIPNMIFLIIIYYIDIYSLFSGFQEYYINPEVVENRSFVTSNTYLNYRGNEKFNSFIFGSSRSGAFRCRNWDKYLDNDSKSFHFDGSGEGLWNIHKKVKFIDEIGDSIKNALVVISHKTLKKTYPRYGHLFVENPRISKESWITFYYQFLKVHYNWKFTVSIIDYSIFKTYRDYMSGIIRNPTQLKSKHIFNNVNCDIISNGMGRLIRNDSLGYYNNLLKMGVFYERPTQKYIDPIINQEEISQLNEIRNIFNEHNTSYKIVIIPMYDQMILGEKQLDLLFKIFGEDNVYNFSGINQFTIPISNYYENSHFKPLVAREIMNIIYSK